MITGPGCAAGENQDRVDADLRCGRFIAADGVGGPADGIGGATDDIAVIAVDNRTGVTR